MTHVKGQLRDETVTQAFDVALKAFEANFSIAFDDVEAWVASKGTPEEALSGTRTSLEHVNKFIVSASNALERWSPASMQHLHIKTRIAMMETKCDAIGPDTPLRE